MWRPLRAVAWPGCSTPARKPLRTSNGSVERRSFSMQEMRRYRFAALAGFALGDGILRQPGSSLRAAPVGPTALLATRYPTRVEQAVVA